MKIGDKVRLIDNTGMNAPIGSIATITREPYEYGCFNVKLVDVKWESNVSKQNDGGYQSDKFELLNKTIDDQKVTQRTTKIDYMAITREICGAK